MSIITSPPESATPYFRRWTGYRDTTEEFGAGTDQAGVNGKVYPIGGQRDADAPTYVDTVYELDPAQGAWVEKARMPTARSSGVVSCD